MVFHNFGELMNSLRADNRATAAVVCAHDRTVLSAIEQCKGKINAILIGNEREIRDVVGDKYEVIDEQDALEAARRGVLAVREKKADFLVKGKLETSQILKAVVEKEHGLRTGRLMSHLAFLEIPTYGKLIVLTDSGMVISPTLEQKREIIENARDTLLHMGYQNPAIALLAAVEKVNPNMPETQDAETLTNWNREGRIADCYVEGPVSYDIAMSPESAEKKGYASPIVGNADVLITANMMTGNILGKALTVSAGAKMAGIIVGAGAPIALTSRGAHVEEKVNSILLAAASIRSGVQG